MTDMSDQSLSVQVEYRLDRMLCELDDLMACAATDEGCEALEANKIGLGQILTRAQLIVSFMTSREPPQLKVIRRG